MRVFIAINIGDEVKDLLDGAVREMKQLGFPAGWTKKENLHLTLKFLGEIDERHLGKVEGLVEEAVKDIRAFDLEFAGIGAFPDTSRPRVIWAGVTGGAKEASVIAGRIDRSLEEKGIAESEKREFSSHVTLGRVKGRMKGDDLSKFAESRRSASFGRSRAKSVDIMKSTLSPKGAVYEVLKSFRLG